jgi:glycosyltransferase involved in cell wall biosynthesis
MASTGMHPATKESLGDGPLYWNRMRILILSPVEPLPVRGGWQLSIFSVLEQLQKRGHDVFLLACTDAADANLKLMQEICPTHYHYKHKPARWRQLIANIGSDMPFSVARHWNSALLEMAKRWTREHDIEIVLLEDLAMAPYGPPLRAACGVPIFIRTHNVMSQLYRRYAEQERNPFKRAAGLWQLHKVERFEARTLAATDGISALSDSDAAEIRRLDPSISPLIIGNGADIDHFQPPSTPRQPDCIAHVGSLTAFTKFEAMLWFCEKVLPLIRSQVPQAELHLAGQTPAERFQHFPGVTVHGPVHDVRPFFGRGRVFIAPQFVGTGVRLKILEAMSTGNAIVCTSTACEGISLIDGTHGLIRDDPESFAQAVVSLLRDEEQASDLGKRARELAVQNCSWSRIGADMEDALRGMVDSLAR